MGYGLKISGKLAQGNNSQEIRKPPSKQAEKSTGALFSQQNNVLSYSRKRPLTSNMNKTARITIAQSAKFKNNTIGNETLESKNQFVRYNHPSNNFMSSTNFHEADGSQQKGLLSHRQIIPEDNTTKGQMTAASRGSPSQHKSAKKSTKAAKTSRNMNATISNTTHTIEKQDINAIREGVYDFVNLRESKLHKPHRYNHRKALSKHE